MSPDDLIPVYDAPCKCGKGRIVVKKYPPAPEFVVEIYSHLVSEIVCPDCAKAFVLKEWDDAICLVRTADILAQEEEQAAYWQKVRDVEKLADSIGYYDALADWLLSLRSAEAALKTLRDSSIFRDWHWQQNFPKAFNASPDNAPMKALVRSYARCPPLYQLMKRSDKSFPELERLVEVWQQQKLSIVPIVEKLCPY